MCVLLEPRILSHIHVSALPYLCFIQKHIQIQCLRFFAITSKGTIMEIWLTRSLNAIPATMIRGVFILYV